LAHRIFITATNTDVGKTYTTLTLLRHYAALGYRVAAFKPIETGVVGAPLDGTALQQCVRELNPELADVSVDAIVPLQFTLPAAPFVASGGTPIDLARLDTALAALEAHCDIILIEGAGGLMVPVDPEMAIIDLIRHFGAKALLVSHCRLGCINDTLLNLMALEQSGVSYEWVLNCRDTDDAFREVSAPYFEARYGEFYLLKRNLSELAAALLA